MFFTSFWITGYKRLRMSAIKTIRLDELHAVNFIIGKNGSGKTSLNNAINLLPIQSSLFEEDGGKGGELTHNGKTYTFESKRVGGGAKHSLWREGEELCKDATSHMYLQKLEEEFGYDKRLHRLATQTIRFTDMKFKERQSTLTEISNLDLTFALSMHEKLLKSLRDIKGAKQHLIRRLADLMQDLSMKGDVEATTARLDKLNARAQQIYHDLAGRREDADVESIIADYLDAVGGWKQSVMQLPKPSSAQWQSTVFGSEEELSNYIRSGESQLMVLEERRRNTLERLDEATAFLQKAKAGEEGLARLKADAVELTRRTKTKPSCWLEGKVKPQSLRGMRDKLLYLHEYRPEDFDLALAERYGELMRQQEELNTRAATANKDIQTLKANLYHAEEALKGGLTCPNCETKVFAEHPPSAEQIAEWKLFLAKREEWLQRYYDSAEKRSETLAISHRGYKWLQSAYRAIEEFPEFELLMNEASVSVENLLRLSPMVENAITELEAIVTYNLDVQNLASVQQLIEAADNADNRTHNMSALEEDLSACDRAIAAQKRSLQEAYAFLEEYQQLRNQYQQICSNVHDAEDWERLLSRLEVSFLTQEFNAVTAAQAEARNFMGQVERIQQGIELVSGDLDKLDEDESILTSMADALSPKTGVIAEQMQGFLGGLTSRINDIINSVWSYPLTVEMPALENGKLEYRFPVTAITERSADIAETSDGQQGIINMAFGLIMVLYSRLENYPLYMDEIGREFDVEHKTRLIRYVRDLVQSGTVQQLFMISHSATDYGDASAANYIALSGDNIALPASANRHCTIIYL